jgi:DNA-binding GntR family transcriptional regulator
MTHLRGAILDGTMAPGQRLVESELSDSLGVPRASVRAALIELASEGLVERIPNRGARVRVVSADEAIAITECRMVLEGLCAAKAARQGSQAQIAQLLELTDQMRQAVEDGEPTTYSELNSEFHHLMLEMSGQRVAADLVRKLRGPLVRHQFRLALHPGRPRESLPEHRAIADAIAHHDPEAAEAAARGHLRSVLAALRNHP